MDLNLEQDAHFTSDCFSRTMLNIKAFLKGPEVINTSAGPEKLTLKKKVVKKQFHSNNTLTFHRQFVRQCSP